MLNGEVAYLKLRIESKGCAKEVEDALTAIYKKHKIKGLVFDLRNNEGGYMGEAIKIANLFVTKGNLLLKTRTKEKDTAYYAIKEAIYPVVPMVVLINNQTISSGEILSGAIQDNDRAVFIGQKSYGKGLIQEIFDMPEKTQLMLTTGSYFTPSGRCIQAFDYQHGIKNIADSLKTSFKTKNGRTVYNIGGISPDIETLYRKPSELKESLLQDNVISDFAADYKLRHPSIPSVKVFHIQVEDYDNFVAFAKTRKTDYKTDTDNKLNNLKESAIKEGLWEAIKPGYELVENNLAVQKEKDFIIHKTEIEDALEEEIVSRYYFKEGRFQSVLSKDTEVQKAIEILMKPMDYNKILNIKN
jgi:carboxyl-terminal processing protease